MGTLVALTIWLPTVSATAQRGTGAFRLTLEGALFETQSESLTIEDARTPAAETTRQRFGLLTPVGGVTIGFDRHGR